MGKDGDGGACKLLEAPLPPGQHPFPAIGRIGEAMGEGGRLHNIKLKNSKDLKIASLERSRCGLFKNGFIFENISQERNVTAKTVKSFSCLI